MTEIIKEWENFALKNNFQPRVRNEIQKSWERCKQKGVDISNHSPLLPAGEKYPCLELEPFAFLKPLFPLLRMQAIDFDCLITLANSDGIITFVDGPERLLEKANLYKLVIGSNWSEKYCGCSAIGIAIEEKKPVSVIGPEHYCASLHNMWCTSAVIHKPESNELFMALTMIGDIAQNPIPISVAVTNATLIETKLAKILYTDRVLLYNKFLEKKGISTSPSFILIDSLGTILHCPEEIFEEFQITRYDPILIKNKPKPHFAQGQFFESDVILGKIAVPAVIEPVQYQNKTAGYIIELKEIFSSQNYKLSPSSSLSPRILRGQSNTQASYSSDSIVGKSPAFVAAIEEAKIAAQNDLPVLLLGETGTGKEVFAKYIHLNSKRSKETFLALNCAAIPKDLVVSELFGFEGGTFTGSAKEGKKGKFLLAHKGTLFLDEIGELPLEIQGSLLRVLEEFEIFPIGAKSPIPVDVRIIAATNQDLSTYCSKGLFRKDLFFRLNIFPIHLPPLRERGNDIELLFAHFVNEISSQLKFSYSIPLNDVIPFLYQYHWPGNVRELRNVAYRFVVKLLHNNSIKKDKLQEIIKNIININKESIKSNNNIIEEIEDTVNNDNEVGLNYKTHIFNKALEKSNGNVSKAAKLLGIHRTTLYRYLKKNCKY
ncbi:sigma 54-interacting transcriptional regulator [Candidatus Methylacidiphilum infernorum]|uniref:Sigma 54-interacting transcriptional regulator n=1 Tax=Candidatus Methylacidiphilum infernorum TaxID=511746 RepID=A0ABX7PVX9_9BACT|nr:sigma 54-interacting transcriptional regulator [Candidatus Methylacidiphilum infernorum]QSR87154.1 sigma 54-interacting transcriptional regulator [Candidatus Methylacidiphilum infernorum]